MTRVHYDRPRTDYLTFYRDSPWHSSRLERPRLMASAVMLAYGEPETVVDPACGDGWVVDVANRVRPIKHAILADVSPGVIGQLPTDWQFPFEVRQADLFDTLRDTPFVDAIVMTEVLEHLEDPDVALRLAREKARWLVASSPCVEAGVVDHTDEHLWSFDLAGYREMLESAGWSPVYWMTVNMPEHPYPAFQVWGCR